MRNLRRGFTLLELVIVLALLGVFMLLSSAMIAGLLRLMGDDEDFYQRVLVQRAVADQFRADVAGAAATVDRAGDDISSPTCLILKRPDEGLIVYRFRDGALERTENADKETWTKTISPGEHAQIAFSQSDPEGRLLSLRWTVPALVETDPPRQSLSFSAALGGDLR